MSGAQQQRRPDRLSQRPEFLAVAASGKKWVTPGMIIQFLPKSEALHLRFGLTASKKVGNAVCRNRARRRLRELVSAHLKTATLAQGGDIVLIARPQTVTRGFADLKADLLAAFAKLRISA